MARRRKPPRTYVREYRARRRASGLCIEAGCSAPAERGRCDFHREKAAEWARRYRRGETVAQVEDARERDLDRKQADALLLRFYDWRTMEAWDAAKAAGGLLDAREVEGPASLDELRAYADLETSRRSELPILTAEQLREFERLHAERSALRALPPATDAAPPEEETE